VCLSELNCPDFIKRQQFSSVPLNRRWSFDGEKERERRKEDTGLSFSGSDPFREDARATNRANDRNVSALVNAIVRRLSSRAVQRHRASAGD